MSFIDVENVKADFFKIYGLTRYQPPNGNMGGFAAIEMQSTRVYPQAPSTSVDSNGIENNINIVLPMRPGELSDDTTVSFERSGLSSNPMIAQLIQIGGKALQDVSGNSGQNWMMGVSDELNKFLLAKYDPSGLNQTLSFDFILPLINTQKQYDKHFVNTTRKYLGALKGLCYPRLYAMGMPPMMKVSVAGLYKGFTGWVNSVSIRTSEDLIAIGDEMFPLVITGTIKFINLFSYNWNPKSENNMLVFNLSNNPAILFGHDAPPADFEDFTAGNNIYSKNEYGEGYKYEINVEKVIKDAKITEYTDNTSLNAKLQENLRNSYDSILFDDVWDIQNQSFVSMSSELNGININYLDNTDYVNNMFNNYTSTNLSSGLSPILKCVNDGTLYNVGLSNLTRIGQLYNNIDVISKNGLSLNSYYNIMNILKTIGMLDNVKEVFGISRTANTSISGLTDSIYKLYDSGVSVVGNTARPLNMSNISEYYDSFNSVAATGTTANNLTESLFASTLTCQNLLYFTQDINNSINTIAKGNIEPISALAIATNIAALSTCANQMLDFENSYISRYAQSSIMLRNGEINSSEYSKYKQMYDITRHNDNTYLTTINESLLESIEKIVEQINNG